MAEMLGRLPGCFAIGQEGIFFEHRRRLDQLSDDAERARQVARTLRTPDVALNQDAETWLVDWVGEHPGADALMLYTAVMDHVTEVTGNRLWVQKATSYIFSAREILTDMSNARMLYMLRNPLDLYASKKRRSPQREYLLPLSVSWRRGYQLARQLETEYPQRLHLVSYEALAEQPEATMKAVCDFIGVPFDPAVFEVAHINPSENAYKQIPGTQGVNRSRVHYFPTILAEDERLAVEYIVGPKFLDKVFPKLPQRDRRGGLKPPVKAVGRILGGVLGTLVSRVQWARRTGVPVRHYLGRRFKAALGRS
jgi:hypothetical protein